MENFDDDIIYFSKLKQNAIIPNKEKENAGYDIYSCFDEDYILLKPFETKLIPTGVAWACSNKYYLQIEERSSTGVKGIKINAGIIDSGYRGEIKIAIFNTNSVDLIFSNIDEENFKNKYPDLYSDKNIFYSTKKAIAQGIVHRVYDLKVKEISIEELLSISSNRGSKGFGSTNKIN